MKKLLCIVLTLVVIVGLFSACSEKSANDANGPIKIGFVGPLTGDSADWGIAQRDQLLIRVKKCNEAGGLLGRKVELYYYDNRDEPVESVNATRKLIENDKVCCIIGPNSSSCAMSMMAVCEEYKIPMIATNCNLEKITVDDNGNARPYVFRSIMVNSAYVDAICKYMADNTTIKTIGVLYQLSSDNHIAIVEQLRTKWAEYGGTIVAEETTASNEDVDFRAQLTKIMESNPDCIFSPFMYKQVILMSQQARQLGYKGEFAGLDTWFHVQIPLNAGAETEGCHCITSLDINDPKLDPIKEEWIAEYGNMDLLSAGGTDPYYAYDSWYMMVDAIEKGNSADPQSIRDHLETMKDVQGCVGLLSVDPATHNPLRELAFVTVEKKEDNSYGYRTIALYYNGEITYK